MGRLFIANSLTVFFLIALFFNCPLYGQLNFERDFALGPAPSSIIDWAEINEKMYFSANDGYFGYELWQFDPATDQAYRLTDLHGLSGSSSIQNMVEYDGQVYFTAWQPELGRDIYRFDPQAWEVERVTVLQDDSFRPSFLTVYNGKLWFTAFEADEFNLWNYDVASNAFTMISPPVDGHPTNFRPQRKFVYNNKLYLNAYTPDNNLELWNYDEITDGFNKVPTQFDGQSSLMLSGFSSCGGELMLNISDDWYHYDEALDSCIFLVGNNSQTYRGGNCINGKFWYPDFSVNDVKVYDPSNGAIEKLKEISNDAPF